MNIQTAVIATIAVMASVLGLGMSWTLTSPEYTDSEISTNDFHQKRTMKSNKEQMLAVDFNSRTDRLNRLEHDLTSLHKSLDDLRIAVTQIAETVTVNVDLEAIIETPMDDHIEEIKYDLTSETIDPDWSLQTETLIYDRIEDEHIDGIDQLDVQCRSTLCAITFMFGDIGSRDKALEIMPLLIPWDTEAIIEILEEDSLSIALYATREGASL